MKPRGMDPEFGHRPCGLGDRIMLTAHDRSRPWYALETSRTRIVFNPTFSAPRGRIEIAQDIRAWASDYGGRLMVEPHVKRGFSADNKDWGWSRWQQLADRAAVPLLQCAPPGARVLDGVEPVETPTFEHAVGVLEASVGIITTDGGLHHAAGALRKPAVVIWGCYSDPAILGYDDHVNLYEPDAAGIGQRLSHPACRAAMQRITVDRVLTAMETAFATTGKC